MCFMNALLRRDFLDQTLRELLAMPMHFSIARLRFKLKNANFFASKMFLDFKFNFCRGKRHSQIKRVVVRKKKHFWCKKGLAFFFINKVGFDDITLVNELLVALHLNNRVFHKTWILADMRRGNKRLFADISAISYATNLIKYL